MAGDMSLKGMVCKTYPAIAILHSPSCDTCPLCRAFAVVLTIVVHILSAPLSYAATILSTASRIFSLPFLSTVGKEVIDLTASSDYDEDVANDGEYISFLGSCVK